MPPAREEPEKALVPSLLQDAAAQAQRIALLEARHTQEVTALACKHNTETAELQARQAQEKKTAVSRILEINQQLAVATTLEQSSLREGRESLAAEIAQMTSPGLTGGDILELNVAGQPMSTTRETLTQVEGSVLASMFGPRWADRQKLDSQGRIFLNFDSYCFEKILSFFMGKLIEHPDRPAPLPVIKPEAKAQFVALVEYLGIKDFMGIENSHDADATAGAGCAEDFHFNQTFGMTLSQEGRRACAVARNGQDSTSFASPAMQRGTLHFIKCCIIKRRSKNRYSDWLFLGITQLCAPRNDAEKDVTSFGWTEDCEYSQGVFAHPPSTPAYEEGDTLIFKVDMAQDVGVLSMRCLEKSKLYRMEIQTVHKNPFYFFVGAVNFTVASINQATATDAGGVIVQLSATTPEDRQHFG